MSDEKCCRVVCKSYKALRSQVEIERKHTGLKISPEAKTILDLLDEMVEDFCEGI